MEQVVCCDRFSHQDPCWGINTIGKVGDIEEIKGLCDLKGALQGGCSEALVCDPSEVLVVPHGLLYDS